MSRRKNKSKQTKNERQDEEKEGVKRYSMVFPAQLLDYLTVSCLYEARSHNYQGVL